MNKHKANVAWLLAGVVVILFAIWILAGIPIMAGAQ